MRAARPCCPSPPVQSCAWAVGPRARALRATMKPTVDMWGRVRRRICVLLHCCHNAHLAPLICAVHTTTLLTLGHEVVLDLSTCELYCLVCRDYVYNSVLDAAAAAARATILFPATCGAGLPPPAQTPSSAGPPPLPPAPLLPSTIDGADGDCSVEAREAEAEALRRLLALGRFRRLPPDDFPAGLRGLNNMGNTCFMNSTLQALLHAPLLSTHYLADRHPRSSCDVTRDGGICLGCEMVRGNGSTSLSCSSAWRQSNALRVRLPYLWPHFHSSTNKDAVVSAAFSGDRSAYSPVHFLHAWWGLAGAHLGGYKQQVQGRVCCQGLVALAQRLVPSCTGDSPRLCPPARTPRPPCIPRMHTSSSCL